jgi:hypothetical protein
MLLQHPSDFQLFGRYAYLGGLNGCIHQVDLLGKEENKVMKLSNCNDPCDLICVIDICKNGLDELTVFTGSRAARSGSENLGENCNNKIRVFKQDIGSCKHRPETQIIEESKKIKA